MRRGVSAMRHEGLLAGKVRGECNSRLSCRTVESYDHLDEAWLEGKPFEMRTMLGREDFLGSTTIARGSADYTNLVRTFNWAKT